MNERRSLYAMALILAIAVLPAIWFRNKGLKNAAAVAAAAAADSLARAPIVTPASDTNPPLPQAAVAGTPDSLGAAPAIAATPEDTVVIRSGLYRYALSTRGAQVISAQFLRYRSLNDSLRAASDTLELIPPGTSLLASRLVVGNDTLRLDRMTFEPSSDSLDVRTAPATLTLRGTSGAHAIELTWTFVPDDYRFDVRGTVASLGSIGGTLLLDLGNGFGNTEANMTENHRESGIVTKLDKTTLKRFQQFTPRQAEVISGPFEWVAVKSKYFVAGIFVADSVAAGGRLSSATVFPADEAPAKPVRAQVTTALTVPARGDFGYRVYLGPMEYDRLTAMGHDFDDVNPYGFAWLRGIIRPFAVTIRAVFLGMHNFLGVSFGVAIILFGILVRILLWPLNQKAMRSITGMQAIQPELQALQERYKDNKEKLQQEMFKLYKEHKVNPFGGCWPMLLPYPLLVAVFFVLQNTIELRGVSFLWMADLSRMDHTYIIPILMAVSMFGISWISQRGMPPNPQAKMMMYIMPGVFLVMFSSFASGLNLYYLVQNLAQIPQQMLINRERRKTQQASSAGTSSTGKKIEVRSK